MQLGALGSVTHLCPGPGLGSRAFGCLLVPPRGGAMSAEQGSAPLRASVSPSVNRGGWAWPAGVGAGRRGSPGGSARSASAAGAPSPGSPPPLGPPGGHVRRAPGGQKRQRAAGRAAKLSHPARGPPGARRAQLPSRTSRVPRGPRGVRGAAAPFETSPLLGRACSCRARGWGALGGGWGLGLGAPLPGVPRPAPPAGSWPFNPGAAGQPARRVTCRRCLRSQRRPREKSAGTVRSSL